MNKWHLRFLRLAYLGLAAILPVYALADYNATQGAGTIFRAFDGTHGGTALCAAANTQCQAIGLVNSAGAEIGTAGAPVRVDPTGTTPQPVNATQTGTWTVQPGNTANTTAWKVDGSAVTQPVSPSTLAAWGLGTSTQNSAVVAAGQLALAQFNTAPATITSTNMSPLQLDTNGNLLVNVKAGGAGGGAVTAVSGAYASGSIVDLGAQADAACATDAGTCSLIALTKRTNQNVAGPIAAGTAHVGTVGVAPYADGAIPLTATATGTTAATTATLAASAGGLKTYICGFSIRANATAAATGNATVTGVITATMNFTQWTAPLASGLGVVEMIFTPCVPSSATNTAIAVVSAAPGTGGVVSVSAWGYQL